MTIHELLSQGYVENGEYVIEIHSLKKINNKIWSGEGMLKVAPLLTENLPEYSGIFGCVANLVRKYKAPINISVELEDEDTGEINNIAWEYKKKNDNLNELTL